MRIKSFTTAILGLFCAALIIESCESRGKCGVTNISKAGSFESHNNGLNCMTCHKSGGEGKGCFVVAGSSYSSDFQTSLTGGTIELYTESNGQGELKYTIQIDGRGNFYTTDDQIDYKGLWASIKTNSGNQHFMGSSLTSGACNSCHGQSTAKLWAEN